MVALKFRKMVPRFDCVTEERELAAALWRSIDHEITGFYHCSTGPAADRPWKSRFANNAVVGTRL